MSSRWEHMDRWGEGGNSLPTQSSSCGFCRTTPQLVCSGCHVPRGSSIPLTPAHCVPKLQRPCGVSLNMSSEGLTEHVVSKISVSQDSATFFLCDPAAKLCVNLYFGNSLGNIAPWDSRGEKMLVSHYKWWQSLWGLASCVQLLFVVPLFYTTLHPLPIPVKIAAKYSFVMNFPPN